MKEIGLIIVVVCLYMLIRAIRFKPKKELTTNSVLVDIDIKDTSDRFSKLIKCKTVSYEDTKRIEKSEFNKFKNLLIDLYPKINEICELEYIGTTGILYKWQGADDSKVNVLMAHYDVVPVDEKLWTDDPFSGKVDDEFIWGRGTLDTKSTLFSAMEAAEMLINSGFIPSNDIYFAFSGDEEISGASAPDIVKYFKNKGIRPDFVLDEGGAIVENVFPGVSIPAAMIGIGEKGYMDIEMSVVGQGGHASAPPPHTLVGDLSKAITRIEKRPFKSSFTPPVLELFDRMGRHSNFGMRIIFSNLYFFKPLLKCLFKKQGGEMNALIRTTVAITKLKGSQAFNVMPSRVSAGLNIRILNIDTIDKVENRLKKITKNDAIEWRIIEKNEPTLLSKTDTPEWAKIEMAINKTWSNVITTPYIMLAASDSRHYCQISDKVFRFSAMSLSKEERGLIHGNNERITQKSLHEAISFYVNLIKVL